MPIAAVCPHCEALYKLADDQAGKRVRCRQCRQAFDVPGPTTAVRAGTHKIDRPLGVPPPPTPPALPPRAPDPPVALPADDPGPERLAEYDREPERDRGRERRPRELTDELPPLPHNLILWVGVGVGGALLLVILLCAGLIFQVSRQVGRGVDRMVEKVRQGPPPTVASAPPVTSLDQALAAVRSANPRERHRGADWLADQVPDPAWRQQVLDAVQPLVDDPDVAVQRAARRAVGRWR